MNITCVYRHIRTDINQPFYIGIGSIKRPFSIKNRNKYWKNIVNLNPDYKIEILFDDISWEEACEKEKELIKLYGRSDLGLGTLCNLTDGGEGNLNVIFSKERIEKIKKANKGKRKSEKFKIQMSFIQKNMTFEQKEIKKKKCSVSSKGRKHTEETKNIIRINSTRRVKSDEEIEKIRQANIGKKHSQQTKDKIKNFLLGKPSLQKGYIRSKESKENISKSHCKNIYYVYKYPSMEFVKEYNNSVNISKDLNISNNISKVINGKLKHIKGYTFVKNVKL